MGVSFFADDNVSEFGRFDRSFYSLFSILAGDSWTNELAEVSTSYIILFPEASEEAKVRESWLSFSGVCHKLVPKFILSQNLFWNLNVLLWCWYCIVFCDR
jgi:hypothetical protein